ncbi:MAG: glycosyltransferase family 39 protein [Campylobacterota bacterium]|nr:glycosyltransferase family 39 protein [Campylobacterota bacterium]
MLQRYNKEIKLVLLVSLFKLIILAFLPLTGDEAYFIKWGQNLDWGYYDHPPMVGWLIYLMSFVAEHHMFFRLFTFFTVFIVAFVMYKIAIEYNVEQSKAFLVSLIFLVAPIDILLVLFTNDVPLLLFGSLGTLFLIYSLEKAQWLRYSLIAGLFFGMAFLSKYFAAFLMLPLVFFSFYQYRFKALKNVIVVSIIVCTFIFQNLYFNYNSCWNNILFNFFARTTESQYNISTVLNYFALIIYLFTPWGIYYLYKSRDNFEKSKILTMVLFILLFVFLIFLLVSLKNSIGLHWFMLFLPYIYMLYLYLDEKHYEKIFFYKFIFSIIHISIVFLIIFLPHKIFEDKKFYNNIILHKYQNVVYEYLDKNYNEIYTTNYTTSAILSTVANKNIYMLFNTSKYGRMDDKLLDVRELNDRDIVLFDFSKIKKFKLEKVCQKVEQKDIYIKGAKFYISKCDNFSYEKYKTHYLEEQKEKFYDLPDWLPVGDCYFNERYFK